MISASVALRRSGEHIYVWRRLLLLHYDDDDFCKVMIKQGLLEASLGIRARLCASTIPRACVCARVSLVSVAGFPIHKDMWHFIVVHAVKRAQHVAAGSRRTASDPPRCSVYASGRRRYAWLTHGYCVDTSLIGTVLLNMFLIRVAAMLRVHVM
jgi:hypothetical protein